MKKILLLGCLFATVAKAQQFAIVVDSVTYAKTTTAINAYQKAVEAQGLSVVVLARQWRNPQQIRDALQNLYQQKPKLEGAVLIGDIPIPMIRNAQFLTTAFKMDQRHDWKRSSVPSDRFYDDFNLKFDFLKQDSLRKDYFYYSLSPASPVYINMNIYTARIKPPANLHGKDQYTLISEYLQKVVALKKEQNKLDNAMVFTGHGYHSQALDAWADEQLALRDQLPALFLPGGNVKFLNYRMAPEMKFRLLSAIQQDELDLAIFHEHGSEDEQIINGYTEATNPQPSIENVKRYLRNKIQNIAEKKGDVQAGKEGFVKSLGVPLNWMDNALDDSVKVADSIANANQDISLTDLAGITPNARFVMLDACETGSFHLDDYLAGYYPFGNGKTVVTMANSVGVLQDNWADEMLGLLPDGVRVGNWLRQTAFLETHLIGDPTFAFAGTESGLNGDIVNNAENAAVWEKRLKTGDANIKALALSRLYRLGKTGALKAAYFNSAAGATRLEALFLLYRLKNNDFYEVLQAAANDPFELIRRQVARMLGDIGDDAHASLVIKMMIDNRNNARVMAALRSSVSFFNTPALLKAIDEQFALNRNLVDSAVLYDKMVADVKSNGQKVERDSQLTFDTKAQLKQRYFNITTLRNYNYHSVIPQVIKLAEDKSDNENLRVAAIEAMSWFTHSYQREEILKMCDRLLADKSEPAAILDQAARTKNIVK